MYKKFDPHTPYFRGVALFLILIGAGILAVGAVEWKANLIWNYNFYSPMSKVIGGLIVLALGYIQLELELIRISRKD